MLKLGGAVIHMNLDLKHLEHVPALTVFDDKVLGFLDTLSKRLLKSRTGYPEIATFAFWIRKASMNALKRTYEASYMIAAEKGYNFILHLRMYQLILRTHLLLG